MPPFNEVKTIEHMIFYQYAKIIAKSSFKHSDGKEAKSKSFGFIRLKFRELASGKIRWSDILREDLQFTESEKACLYCGSKENIEKEHIVPKSIKLREECKTCEKINGIHNIIWACKSCNGAGGKGMKGLYTFYRDNNPSERKFHDIIPPLVEKKYLKTIYNCHECMGTLNETDINADGDITVFDIDFILTKEFKSSISNKSKTNH